MFFFRADTEPHTYNIKGKTIQIGVVGFWALYWMWNVVDKLLGEPMFLFVGKDRFAQFAKFFGSLGLQSPATPLFFLGVTTFLEIAAFVLMVGALLYLLFRRAREAREFFFWGTFVGLALFSFFIIGDQIFGDRAEVLEHTIYWAAIIISWGAFVYYPREETVEKSREREKDISPRALWSGVGLAIVAVLSLSVIIITAQTHSGLQSLKQHIVEPVYLDNGIYSFTIPFIGTKKMWKRSLDTFIFEHPELRITALYTLPSAFKKGKAENVVIWVFTENVSR